MEIERERAKDTGERSGKLENTSLRLDSGLKAALKAQAQAEGISLTEAVHRAIEAYLR